MTKKKLWAVLLILLAVLLLASCGKKQKTPSSGNSGKEQITYSTFLR